MWKIKIQHSPYFLVNGWKFLFEFLWGFNKTFKLLFNYRLNRIGYTHPSKLRFENSSNKKTLKQAWRFFLSNYLFVTPAGFKPATLRAEI